MIENLTDDEKEFLERYRQLSEYEQGYVSGVLEAEVKRIRKEKRKGFHAAEAHRDHDDRHDADDGGAGTFLRDFKPR